MSLWTFHQMWTSGSTSSSTLSCHLRITHSSTWETQSLVFQSDMTLCKRFCWMNTASRASNDCLKLHVEVDRPCKNCFILGVSCCFYWNCTITHHHWVTRIRHPCTSSLKWQVAGITSLWKPQQRNPHSESYLTILVAYLLKYTCTLTSSHQQGFVKLSPAWQCSRSFLPCELAQPVTNLSWRPVKRRWIA